MTFFTQVVYQVAIILGLISSIFGAPRALTQPGFTVLLAQNDQSPFSLVDFGSEFSPSIVFWDFLDVDGDNISDLCAIIASVAAQGDAEVYCASGASAF